MYETKKSSFQMITDAIKAVYRFDRTVIFTMLALSVIRSASPYIMIFTSSYVLDGLASGMEITRLAVATAIGLGAVFTVHVIQGYIEKIEYVHNEICVKNFDMELSKRTLTMDYQLLDSPLANNIRDRIKTDNNWGAGFYSMFHRLPPFLNGIFGLIAALCVTVPLFINGKIFSSPSDVVFISSLFVIIFGISLFDTKHLMKKEYALMDEHSGKPGYFGHFLYGSYDYKSGKDVRIYGAQELIEQKISNNDEWANTRANRMSLIGGMRGFSSGLSSGILKGGTYLFLVLRAAAGALTVGEVVMYAASLSNFVGCIINIVIFWGHLSVASRRQQGKLDYMNIPNVMHKGTLPVEKRRDNEYEIEFKNVSFKYPGSELYALKNLSMKLQIGQRLAVVGMNGSGKTTMIKLLCRLYDPTEGEITLNGFNIKKYDYSEYMRIFSVVFQDFRLFSFPLGQNVASSVDIDENKAGRCLEMAGFGNKLRTMPQGLSTPLYSDYENGGVEISGGEAQKIAIARALYKDAPFIVLDEPTAALDPIAEYEVYSKFNEIVGSKTAVYISHRLSSCRFCDDIAVFHDGELVQRGSHDSLLSNKKGKYYELWNAQAQYYTEDSAI